jgi:amino acid transporter
MASFYERFKTLLLGKAKDPFDAQIFHKLSLIAFFAWIGLGADGISSSCYGPEEAFLALGAHSHLAIIIALATAFTIFIIGTSYSQIIELFPSGGGGYVVATKLLSPNIGMVSGCALLVDYILTIAISIASGSDAIFSFLPIHFLHFKLFFALSGVLVLTVLNLRGIKESVMVLLPIFLAFIITHALGITVAFATHASNLPVIMKGTVADFHGSYAQLGLIGMVALLLRSYAMGAGTYTGIEAVSNAVNILREPKVQTAKRTMMYMMVSLATIVMGLMFAYLLFGVNHQPGKTLNAVLFRGVFGGGTLGTSILLLTLISEAAILFVAAQTGLVGGPKVIATMALDRWFPSRFSMLSDRLVTQNGILFMGAAALAVLLITGGSVRVLVVLYSINVFITFALSQLGMVRHWWHVRKQTIGWQKKLGINTIGLILTMSILISITTIKFYDGGWITLLVTGSLIAFVVIVKQHYIRTGKILRRLDGLVTAANLELLDKACKPAPEVKYNPKSKTAILLVNGFNGLGLHTLFNVFRMFKDTFQNFVIVQVGLVDAGVFKGSDEMGKLEEQITKDIQQYVDYIKQKGYYAEGVPLVGVDVVDEITQAAPDIIKKFPDSIFFGGQLVFPEEGVFPRWLHNYTVFAIQRKFYYLGVPVVLLPIRL